MPVLRLPKLILVIGLALAAAFASACTVRPQLFPASTDVAGSAPATLAPRQTPKTSTPTPLPTNTPTPSPTPTPLPAMRLDRASRALFNGDYETALAEYTAVLAGPGADQELRTAQFGSAQARYLQNNSDTAGLQSFVSSFPTDPRASQAWFWLGEARMKAEDYAGAAEAYTEYHKLRGDVLGPYFYERLGDALRANKQAQAAIPAYQAGLAGASTGMAVEVREKLAGALLDQGDPAGAVAQYDAILAVAQIPAYRARIQTLAAQALASAGQPGASRQRLQSIVDTYATAAGDSFSCPSGSNYAYDALVSLVDDGVAVDEFQRGVIDYCAQKYDPALAAFTRAIQAGRQVASSRYFAGLAFRAQGDTQNALRQYNLIIQGFPQAREWGPAWLEKGQTFAAAGDAESAIAVYREIAQSTERAEGPEALWRTAQLQQKAGRRTEAAQTYRTLQATFPASDRASEALYRAGLAARLADDDSAALNAWTTLSNTYPASSWTAAGMMWQGKALLAQGQTISATEAFSRAAAVNPIEYYSVRASEWLRGESRPLQPVSSTLPADEYAQRTAAENWIAARLGITDTATLRGLREDVASNAALQRGWELQRLGLLPEAGDEFAIARQSFQGDVVALYQMAILFRDLGAFHPSISTADALIRTLGVRVTEAPPFLGRLLYPTYYADLIVPEAKARGLDPLLVFALVRQESLFENVAYSSAAAHGLMQIIPSTGQEIAGGLRWPNYARTDLYKPYISIKFGVYYLARQRDALDGDLYAALAAYNGGPGNAAAWKANAGGDPDMFYETISYSETKLYIRRITEFYEMYVRLYGTR